VALHQVIAGDGSAGLAHDGTTHTYADSVAATTAYRAARGMPIDSDAARRQAAADFVLATYLPPRAVRS